MDYIIGNGTKYINCDITGKYQLCDKGMAKTFTEKAANGFIRHTPKQFRKYHMRMFPVCEKSEHEIKQEQILMKAAKHAKKSGCVINKNKTEVKSEEYSTGRWLNKLRTCNKIKSEAQERLDYLYEKLSLIDQAQDVMLHVIENNSHPNAFDAYKERMKLLEIRKKRRELKDELTVVQIIVSNDVSSKMCDHLASTISGLKNPQNLDIKYSVDVANRLIKEFEEE